MVGSGTVSNKLNDGSGKPVNQGGAGYACLAEVRTIETILEGKPKTPYLKLVIASGSRCARRANRVSGLKSVRDGGTFSDVQAGHPSAQRFHAFIPFGNRFEFIELADEERT
jgi:hypothetical protein